MLDIVETTYKCTRCGSIDHDRSDHPPVTLNCWHCSAGFGKPIPKMIEEGEGMFPAEAVPVVPHGDALAN